MTRVLWDCASWRTARQTLLAAVALGPLFSVAAAEGLPPPAAPAAGRQAELLHLLRQDCGACHGMTLQGGLGTPLTASALRDKPAESLVATILQGRAGTAMPPWKSFITEAEAQWMVHLLQNGAVPSR